MDPQASLSDHSGGVYLGAGGTHPVVLAKTLMLKMHQGESERGWLMGEKRGKSAISQSLIKYEWVLLNST